jgi:hypothetical protein
MTEVDVYVRRIREACSRDPINWDVIRSAAIALDTSAGTKEQINAVWRLKIAATRPEVARAAISIERAFLHGRPDHNGRPRRF